MGHGTDHFSDAAYAAMEYHFRDVGRDDIFVGTVEGFPDFDTMMRHVETFGAHRTTLLPLMVVCGDHAQNDMAGEEPGSWKSMIGSMDYNVECIMRGLGEYEEVRSMYVERINRVFARRVDNEASMK
jgi:sirohydrochlorin cobaltochelatase